VKLNRFSKGIPPLSETQVTIINERTCVRKRALCQVCLKGAISMVLHFKLEKHKFYRNQQGNMVLKLKVKRKRNSAEGNSLKYYAILRSAFPHLHFSAAWEDRYEDFDWGVFINDISKEDESKVRILLQLFQETVCLDDSLMQSFALDHHFAPVGRSEIGEKVYQAKYQSPKNDDVQNFTQCANDSAQMMYDFIATHPVYGQADMIMSVPPTRQRKIFDLPAFLVRYIAEKSGIENISFCITKMRQTAPQKDMETL
jgi:hypothetical protein